jgi:hypothetical protein
MRYQAEAFPRDLCGIAASNVFSIGHRFQVIGTDAAWSAAEVVKL